MPLFADDIILYLENSKDSTNKLLKLIYEFSKVSGYKINIQKSIAFLYIKNELSEREIKKTISQLHQKEKKKKVSYKFNQEVKLLYSEYYKTLMKETESCINKSDDSPSS